MKYFVLLFVFLSGCAQPKYVEIPGSGQGAATKTQASVAVECAGKFSSGSCVSVRWEADPVAEQLLSFTFKVAHANALDGSPVMDEPENLKVWLWMPDMGHGSSPIFLERLDRGTYRASRIYFSMPGKWEIRFSQSVNNETQQIFIPLTIN